MQLQDKKILQLIISNDIETKKLGELALTNKLNKKNAIYWYLTLNEFLVSGNVIYELEKKFSEVLPWLSMLKPHKTLYITLISQHFLKTKKVDAKSYIKFFDFYNDYLLKTLSVNCDIKIKNILTKKIQNGYEFTRQLD